jgi:hypothetical protein
MSHVPATFDGDRFVSSTRPGGVSFACSEGHPVNHPDRPTAPSIYISYRPEDVPEHVRRLIIDLAQHFGPDSIIDPHTEAAVARERLDAFKRSRDSFTVVLVVVGLNWLVDLNRRRRPDEAEDPIAEELTWALADVQVRLMDQQHAPSRALAIRARRTR